MLGAESCKVCTSVSCTTCVRCSLLLHMAYAQIVLLHSLEESTTHVQGIFRETTRGVTVCGFVQKTPEEPL